MNYIQAANDGWNLVWSDGQIQKFSTLRFANDFLQRMKAKAVVLNANGERMN